MPSYDLSDLLARTNENLDVEFKAWMDPRDNETRAKLARHLAALANHGGGYLVFGVDDKARTPLGATELDLALFSQDAITGIVRKYLDPRFSSSTSCMKGLRIRLSWFPHTERALSLRSQTDHRTTGIALSACRRGQSIFGHRDRRARLSAEQTTGIRCSIVVSRIGVTF
ncbi:MULTISPECIES: AlbA family DNA-binding domain-containing protein [Bradyrhizobium]|uniref:AlbA family DNA-binding domain-containing protein n=1 Tax=Bradyrhizobium TaxID=374 RepID=UPI0005762EE4